MERTDALKEKPSHMELIIESAYSKSLLKEEVKPITNANNTESQQQKVAKESWFHACHNSLKEKYSPFIKIFATKIDTLMSGIVST